jgi:hypothetical protein
MDSGRCFLRLSTFIALCIMISEVRPTLPTSSMYFINLKKIMSLVDAVSLAFSHLILILLSISSAEIVQFFSAFANELAKFASKTLIKKSH